MESAENKTARFWQYLDLRVDAHTRQVWRDDELLGLQGLSLDLLLYLLPQGLRVVTGDELIAAVWQGRVVSDEALTQRVKLLRQALSDDSRSPRYLRSVRGVGYQLCAEPRVLDSQLDVKSRNPSGFKRPLWAWSALAATLILLVAGYAYWFYSEAARDRTDVGLPANVLSSPSEPAAPSQADTLAVDVADLLRQAREYQDRGQADDNGRAIMLYRQVLSLAPNNRAAQVGLSHSLSQRVCLFNDSVALLVEAEALARAVIDQGQGREPGLNDGQGHGALAHVYDCRGWVDLALAQYARAIELSPEDAAYLASYAYLMMVRGELVDALEANLRAAQQQQRLHFLDLQLAHVLELMGFVDAAELRYRRTFELYPDNVFGNLAYPRFLYLQGRLQEAQQRLDEALARGVPRPGLFLLQAELALLHQQPEQASAALAQASEVNPQRSYATTLHRLHDEKANAPLAADEGSVPVEAALISPEPGESSDLPDDWKSQTMAEVLASVDAGNTWPDTWLQLALLELSQGQPEAALTALNEAVDRGFLDRNYLLISPWFAELRTEPGFLNLLERIGESLRRQRQTVLNANWVPTELLLPNVKAQSGEDSNVTDVK